MSHGSILKGWNYKFDNIYELVIAYLFWIFLFISILNLNLLCSFFILSFIPV